MIRVGYIGLDSSHCTAFTELFHSRNQAGTEFPVTVALGVPGGNPDFPPSRDRVAGFTQQMRSLGVRIVDSVEDVLPYVDAIILGSVDGRQHLELAERIFPAGKPVFVDKPLAHNLADAIRIADLAENCGTPWFSSSALRYQHELLSVLDSGCPGQVIGCDSFGPSKAADGHSDLAWYGIHGLELLFAVFGGGCQSVTRCQTRYSESVVCRWTSDRIGCFRGIREETHKGGWGVTLFGTERPRHISLPANYDGLVCEIAKFFHSRQAPFDHQITRELFALIEAADASLQRGGSPVLLSEFLTTPRPQTENRSC